MKTNPVIVYDTNIVISGIIFGGNPRRCIEFAQKGKVTLLTSPTLLFELSTKLKTKFHWSNREIQEVIEGISFFARIVRPRVKITLITNDKSDNAILECAKEGNADYILSGDKKHLLNLISFEEIPILTPKDFLDIYYD